MKKLLIITPHLSTGGLPQFLLDKIGVLIQSYDLYLVEWNDCTGGVYVVQRTKIKNILKDRFFSLSEDKTDVIKIINQINPDIIHFEEFCETFIDNDICRLIYNDKSWFITETTHGIGFNLLDKKFIADKYMFVSDYNYNQYHSLGLSEVIKYPNYIKRRNEILQSMNLDPTFKHVLNVGLFNSFKNQGEIFEYARKFENEKVLFHFVGNQAINFIDYWSPLMENKPDNCIVWGELENVSDFYKCMDLFLFTSKLENRPLSVLEALSNNMNVLMYDLKNYSDDFSNKKNIKFLTKDKNYNLSLIKESLGILEIQPLKGNAKLDIDNNILGNVKLYHILTDINTDREIRSMQSLTKIKKYGVDYKMIISKRYTDLPPKDTCAFPDIIGMEPGGKLTPSHYGCYLGHRNAFECGFKDDCDYMLICECDCILDVNTEDFMEKLISARNIIEKEDLLLFSFGYHNNQGIIEEKDDYYIIDHFIGAHAYLIPKKSYHIIKNLYDNEKWNVADLFLANNLRSYRQGIFKTPITKQAGGLSILENEDNEDRY